MYIVKYSAQVHHGEGRTSLRVRLRHMNECRIFHNIHSITFLLYTFYINLLVSLLLSTYEIKIQYRKINQNCFKFEITLRHWVSSYIFNTTPNGAKVKMTSRIGCDVSKQMLTLTKTRRHFPFLLSCISYENLHYYPLTLFSKSDGSKINHT